MDGTGPGLNACREHRVAERLRPASRGGLLDGIVADASGLPMLSTHCARPRFFIAIPLGEAKPVVARVPIVAQDKFVKRRMRIKVSRSLT